MLSSISVSVPTLPPPVSINGTGLVLVRWLNVQPYPSEGVDDTSDLILSPYVFVASSVDDARRIIEQVLVNDELLLESAGTWEIDSTKFTWQNDLSIKHECEYNGEICALAFITPMVVETPA